MRTWSQSTRTQRRDAVHVADLGAHLPRAPTSTTVALVRRTAEVALRGAVPVAGEREDLARRTGCGGPARRTPRCCGRPCAARPGSRRGRARRPSRRARRSSVTTHQSTGSPVSRWTVGAQQVGTADRHRGVDLPAGRGRGSRPSVSRGKPSTVPVPRRRVDGEEVDRVGARPVDALARAGVGADDEDEHQPVGHRSTSLVNGIAGPYGCGVGLAERAASPPARAGCRSGARRRTARRGRGRATVGGAGRIVGPASGCCTATGGRPTSDVGVVVACAHGWRAAGDEQLQPDRRPRAALGGSRLPRAHVRLTSPPASRRPGWRPSSRGCGRLPSTRSTSGPSKGCFSLHLDLARRAGARACRGTRRPRGRSSPGTATMATSPGSRA